jgi:MFS transporter, CP family, cyanate transporter
MPSGGTKPLAGRRDVMMRSDVLQPGQASGQALLLGGVALIGLNLRPFLTAIGPLAASISRDTGLDFRGMAWLTLVPMVLMGVCAFAAPMLQRLLGARRAVIAALVLLGCGSALRLFASEGADLIGTAVLCGLGAAIVQAVFPGIIKQQFPERVAVVTGLYSSMLMGGGALGAQASPLVAGWSGSWRIALAWLAIPAALATAVAFRSLPRTESRSAARPQIGALLARPRTWLLMVCFGLVNGGYSSLIAWLAPFYQAHGWNGAMSGSLVALMAASQAASALLVPVMAARQRDRRPWLWLTLVMQALGFAGLGLWPDMAPGLWAVVIGAGLGGSFALSLVVALDHLPDAAQAGALSALMQGGGFLIAAIPPWITALLHDLTGDFDAAWFVHLSCVALVAALTIRLAPGGYEAAMGAGRYR